MQTPLGLRYSTLIHFTTSLVRSKLSYRQEVYCSASKCLVQNLQNLESKSVKLVLGIPLYPSIVSSYIEGGTVPLGEFRKLALATYFVRASSVESFTDEELDVT